MEVSCFLMTHCPQDRTAFSRPESRPQWQRAAAHGYVFTGTTSKSGSTPILKCPTQFPLILWHPYARHYYFCMMTEAEQDKWQAVLQDCVRHCNNGEMPAGSSAY